MTVATGTLTGTLEDSSGAPLVGATITATPQVYGAVTAHGVVVTSGPVSTTTGVPGTFSLTLAATDDPATNPTGFTYRVSITPPAGVRQWFDPFSIAVPTGATVDLSQVVKVGANAGTVTTPVASVGIDSTGTPYLLNAAQDSTTQPDTKRIVTRADGDSRYASIYTAKGVGDETAALNAWLAATSPLGVKRLVGNPTISAPLILPSGTHLDASHATVTLAANSNCNMVQNAAVAANLRILDAAMTSGSGVLTSATGAFTSGMVGQAVTVQGAGATGPLTTTVASYQSATQVTLTASAGATVSGQYAAIGARDSNITVVGGLWDRGANGSTPQNGVNAHTMRFRHVDSLRVRDARFNSTGGKYQVNPGDCTRINISDLNMPTVSSDGVHFNGPCSQVIVRSIMGGTMGDDLVSFTARDSTAVITDCAGDITDVVVDTVSFPTAQAGLTASALKLVAGKTTDGSAPYAIRRISARNLTSPTATAAVVFLGDSSGGTFDDITLENVRSLGGSYRGCVNIHGGDSVDRITLRNLVPDPNDSWTVGVDVSVGRLDVNGIKLTATSGSPNGVLVSSGTVNRLVIDKCQCKAPAGSLLRVSSGAAVSQAILAKNTQEGGFNLISGVSGATLPAVAIMGLESSGSAYPFGVLSTTTTLSASNAQCAGMTAWLWVTGSGLVTVIGANGLSGDNDTYLGAVNVATANSNVFSRNPDLLATGEETIPRTIAGGGGNTASGNMILTYFTARKTETVNNVRTVIGGGAGAGCTLARIGIYTIAANGDLTLVASTANDVTLWNGSFAVFTRALSASWSKVAGTRYALGTLFVGTTTPKYMGLTPLVGSEMGQSPRLNGTVTGLSDLPATVTAGTVGNAAGISVYAALTP